MIRDPLDVALDYARRGEADASEAILRPLAAAGDLAARFNMGWHHCRHDRLGAGIEALSVGRWLNVFGSPRVLTDKPIWHGEPLDRATLLLRGEGGFGDQIANFRFAENFKRLGAKVIVACEPGLWDVFRHAPYVDACVHSSMPHTAMFDYWVPAMSAIVPLGLEYKDLSGAPYLSRGAPTKLPGSFRVGLRWAGDPTFEDEQRRQFPSDLMVGLSDIPGPTFYSLQRDHGVRPLPPSITDLQLFLTSWGATAQMIASMDLVITSCTSIAHLSAAMGVPTWIVVPVLSYYLWAMPGDTSPWYDSVKLFRQEEFGSWEAPFARLRSDLTALYGSTPHA